MCIDLNNFNLLCCRVHASTHHPLKESPTSRRLAAVLHVRVTANARSAFSPPSNPTLSTTVATYAHEDSPTAPTPSLTTQSTIDFVRHSLPGLRQRATQRSTKSSLSTLIEMIHLPSTSLPPPLVLPAASRYIDWCIPQLPSSAPIAAAASACRPTS